MTRSVVSRLVLKDLYLSRWVVISSLLAGLFSVAIMPLSGMLAYVGGVSLICTLVILNIVLVMNTVVHERKDKVLLFVLSLPISPSQYTLAKVIANAVAFGASWLILAVVAALVIDLSLLPNGWLPFLFAVLVYLLAYFCILLATALNTASTGWTATVITVGNISINFLIPFLLRLPSVSDNLRSPTAVWTTDLATIVAIEIAVGAAALATGLYARSRASEFV
jgi:ABC-type transport system involved in multi-copper enzyme maturation permease subunit